MLEENFENILLKIKDHERRISVLEDFIQTNPKKKKKTSIREFLNNTNAKNDVDKSLAMGYFLENYENMNNFNKIDIQRAFLMAKEKSPENINYKLFRNIQKGFLMELDERKNSLKAWTLTNSGITFVEEKLIESRDED